MTSGPAERVPEPPDPFPGFNTIDLEAGSPIVRLHDPDFGGAVPNPCKGDLTRFAPIRQADGTCIPTLYAGQHFECAVFESIFHDVPHVATPRSVRLQKVTARAVTWLETTVPLRLACLNEPDLNRLGMSRENLIDTPASHYHRTARWAEAFWSASPDLMGLTWTSRRCDPAQAYLFFGDRLPAGALREIESVRVSESADRLEEIRRFGQRAAITLSV